MIRRPPRSTRTDTLFPYTTLFRALLDRLPQAGQFRRGQALHAAPRGIGVDLHEQAEIVEQRRYRRGDHDLVVGDVQERGHDERSEERRVGKECDSKFRSWWSPSH